jgi:hypothetical protein
MSALRVYPLPVEALPEANPSPSATSTDEEDSATGGSACAACGQGFRSVAGHCAGGRLDGCCRSFRGAKDFDKHRTGGHSDGTRRCKSDAELLAQGWVQVHDILPGLWASPATLAKMADRSRAWRAA